MNLCRHLVPSDSNDLCGSCALVTLALVMMCYSLYVSVCLSVCQLMDYLLTGLGHVYPMAISNLCMPNVLALNTGKPHDFGLCNSSMCLTLLIYKGEDKIKTPTSLLWKWNRLALVEYWNSAWIVVNSQLMYAGVVTNGIQPLVCVQLRVQA